jgi:hypothetical protein
MTARYRRKAMSESSDQQVAEVEKRIDGATATLSGLAWLTPDEAQRIGAHIDGLASQVAALSPPAGADRRDDLDRAD